MNEVTAFALATFGESINPGPTIAALVLARTSGWRGAWGVVVGVAFSNIAWVIVVFVLKLLASQLPPWPEVVPVLKAFSALILVYIATRASAHAAITGIESYILKNWDARPETAPADDAMSFVRGLGIGFVVHLLNPLSLTYYFGAYSGTLAKDPSLALVFSLVAVLVDFLVYGAIASFPVGLFARHSPAVFVVQRAFALLASFAMLYLVAHVFAIDRGHRASSELHGLRNLLMSLGFLAGAIWEAEIFAVRSGGKNKKLLWRGVLVWQSAFATFAIIGTFLSVLGRIDPDGFGIDQSAISAMATCSLVAAVATATLSYARARGQMLDEAANAGVETVTLKQTRSLNSPKFVFPAIFVGLVVLFAFFFVSGFSH